MATKIWAARAACLIYLIVLTILLLVPDPFAWLLGLAPDITPPSRGLHLCAFFILATLCGAARPPWPTTGLVAALIVYAVVIESLQGFVETRVVETADYAENLLGLAAGAIVWKLGCRLVGRTPPPKAIDD